MLSINNVNFNTFQTSTKAIGKNGLRTPNKRLQIFYFNDLHGNTDKIAGVMEAGKNFNNNTTEYDTFSFSGGDNVSGGDVKKNEVVLDIMQNEMRVDASGAGNHEMDATANGLKEFAKGKKIDFVATNVEFDDDAAMRNIVKRSVIKVENGTKYGLIGAMPLDFETCTKKSIQEDIEVMDFDDTIKALQKEIDELKSQGVERIILLSHTGYENDKKIAAALEGLDIIIGGHSHSVVQGASEGENIVLSKSNQPVVITQAGENGKYYGILDVEFDANGVISKVSNQLTEISSRKNPNVEFIKEQKMGISPTVGTIKEIEPMAANRRVKPHAWSNMIVDSMRFELGADCAFLNAANIRKIPTEGKLTERDVTESAPMKNRLIKTKVTQKQVVDAISQAAKETLTSPNGEPGFLFTSGFTYKVDTNGNLLELNFIDKKGRKQPIDINNPSEKITYTAIYDDFTMKEGGEYPALAPKFPVKFYDFDKDKTAIDYIRKMKNKNNLVFSDDNRLEIIQASSLQQQGSSNQKFLDLTLPKVS
ncbi:MAG: bifunctional metallophosphatase/5'-nucleotidase [Candidatus Gastranaerophilales bacterium]|nr:bifunctional metallophosphatase/5'-nucleotidase [Candidatus Gastranaerophilales bacterium]